MFNYEFISGSVVYAIEDLYSTFLGNFWACYSVVACLRSESTGNCTRAHAFVMRGADSLH